MVICLERGADLHMAQLVQLPLTISCFSKIQIGFIFLVPAHLRKGPLNGCMTAVVGNYLCAMFHQYMLDNKDRLKAVIGNYVYAMFYG